MFVLVVALHLLFIAALIETTRERNSLTATEHVVGALIYLPDLTPAAARANRAPAMPKAPPTAKASPASEPPAAHLPQQPEHRDDVIDWTANAQQAARNILAAEAIEHARNSKMGAGWWLAQDMKQQRRVGRTPFPWSRQPGPSGVDIDPESFVITFRLNRRCQVSVFLILPGFGCALGHLDPEPGRADLFDPKYRSVPIELPPPNFGVDADH